MCHPKWNIWDSLYLRMVYQLNYWKKNEKQEKKSFLKQHKKFKVKREENKLLINK
jgi:hypothetical protein